MYGKNQSGGDGRSAEAKDKAKKAYDAMKSSIESFQGTPGFTEEVLGAQQKKLDDSYKEWEEGKDGEFLYTLKFYEILMPAETPVPATAE